MGTRQGQSPERLSEEVRRFLFPTSNQGKRVGSGLRNDNDWKTSCVSSALPAYHPQGLFLDGSCLERGCFWRGRPGPRALESPGDQAVGDPPGRWR